MKFKDRHFLKSVAIFRRPALLLVIAIGCCMFSCNPNRDRWLNRNFHTLTGHYNVYFNGLMKLQDGVMQLENTHKNDFTKVLQVFPTGTSDAAKAAGNLFDEAIKKFSKSIQMHTVGRYTDDSYYQMAVTRYYKEDYFASIETFQFILIKYKGGDYEDLSACWIARDYVGLKKLGEAEALIGQLLAKKNFRKNDIGLIYATAADIHIRQEKYTAAIDNLKKALEGNLTKKQKIRYNYILGQLCMLTDRKPEATLHFNKVLRYLPDYDFAFNATISLTRIYDLNDARSVARVKKSLRRMSRDEKNLDYRDQIWYEMGKVDLAAHNTTEAASDFKKSVSFSTKNKNQKGLSYYELARLYFDLKQYKLAEAYYDSTVMTLDQEHRQYKEIKDTKAILSELIQNLKVYETEDSLQRLALLSRDELNRKADGWIAEEKRKQELAAKEAKKRAKLAASAASNPGDAGIGGAPPTLPGTGGQAWYFYNPALVAAGAQEFFAVKKWGPRLNEDFWRLAAKEKPRTEPEADTTKDAGKGNEVSKSKTDSSSKEVVADKKDTLSGNTSRDQWLKNVPFSKSQKDRSNARLLEAMNNLGYLYYERLHNPTESSKYYRLLQNRFPISEYEPQAFYYLYRSLTDLKNPKEAETNKQQLITAYPEHPLSLLVQNKTIQSAEASGNKLLQAAYVKVYEAYNSGNYVQAVDLRNALDKQFPGNPLKPKTDLLYAMCIGRIQGKDAFKAALTEVSNTHKGLDVAARADEYLAILSREEKKAAIVGKDSTGELDFDPDTETPYYYVIAFSDTKVDLNEFVNQYSMFNEAYATDLNLRVNQLQSNEGFQLLTIREFPNYKSASEYMKTLRATEFKAKKLKYTEQVPEFLISTKNFRTVLKEKKIVKFTEFYKRQEAALNQQK